MKAIYRYEVPVDDQPHGHTLRGGQILHAACRRGHDLVEFWASYELYAEPAHRRFQIYRTGLMMADLAVVHASIVVGSLVWHLVELPRT